MPGRERSIVPENSRGGGGVGGAVAHPVAIEQTATAVITPKRFVADGLPRPMQPMVSGRPATGKGKPRLELRAARSLKRSDPSRSPENLANRASGAPTRF